MQSDECITWALDKLLEDWIDVQENYSSTSVTGLSLDSRSASEGDLFFALQGLQQHGIEHGQQAVANGAKALAWETSSQVKQEDLPNSVPCLEVNNLQAKLGLICKRFYGNPSAQMNVVAVTGTDGKTSVSQFIAQALHALNAPCGVIGTLGYGVYPQFEAASHTTPDAVRMHGLLSALNVKNINHAVIEASSHGLQQGRLNGVEIDTAVFTNLGRDHMDYHATIEEYFNSKRLLFLSAKLKNAVVNIDDDAGLRLAKEFSATLNVVTYSIDAQKIASSSFVNATTLKSESGETSFEIDSSWGNAIAKTRLVGKFNISNLLAVLGSLLVSGIKFDQAVSAISNIKTVPGRMEFLDPQVSLSDLVQPAVVVDYAHTPQALINVLSVLKPYCKGKLWCVFGCGGNRDQGKRKLMAQAVEQYADVAVLTDDNPRFEEPEAITDEVKAGFSAAAHYFLIHDRKQAIEHAIQNAGKQDIVLIAGKGHETVQIIKHDHLPFDDKKIASHALLELVS